MIRASFRPGEVQDEAGGLGPVEVNVGGEVAVLVEVVELDVRRPLRRSWPGRL